MLISLILHSDSGITPYMTLLHFDNTTSRARQVWRTFELFIDVSTLYAFQILLKIYGLAHGQTQVQAPSCAPLFACEPVVGPLDVQLILIPAYLLFCRKDFKKHCEFFFKAFGERVKHRTTINEPFVVAGMGPSLGIPKHSAKWFYNFLG